MAHLPRSVALPFRLEVYAAPPQSLGSGAPVRAGRDAAMGATAAEEKQAASTGTNTGAQTARPVAGISTTSLPYDATRALRASVAMLIHASEPPPPPPTTVRGPRRASATQRAAQLRAQRERALISDRNPRGSRVRSLRCSALRMMALQLRLFKARRATSGDASTTAGVHGGAKADGEPDVRRDAVALHFDHGFKAVLGLVLPLSCTLDRPAALSTSPHSSPLATRSSGCFLRTACRSYCP